MLQGSSCSSAADLTVPVVLRSVRMVRPFGDELVAVDAAAVVIVVIVVTAAQVLAFYKALEHEHEAVRARLPPLSKLVGDNKSQHGGEEQVRARATAYGQLRAKRVCPLLPM